MKSRDGARTSWPGLSASGAGIRLPSAENLTLRIPAGRMRRTRSPLEGVRIPAGRTPEGLDLDKQTSGLDVSSWPARPTRYVTASKLTRWRPAAPDRLSVNPMSPANSPDGFGAPLAVRPPEFVARESGWRPDALPVQPGSRLAQ